MAKKQSKKQEEKVEEVITEEVKTEEVKEEVKTESKSGHVATREFFWSGKTYKKGDKVELKKEDMDLLLSKKIIE